MLAKEYSTPLGWTLPIVFIGLYNVDTTTGLAERPEAVATLWGVLGAVTAFWLFGGLSEEGSLPAPEQCGLTPSRGSGPGRGSHGPPGDRDIERYTLVDRVSESCRPVAEHEEDSQGPLPRGGPEGQFPSEVLAETRNQIEADAGAWRSCPQPRASLV